MSKTTQPKTEIDSFELAKDAINYTLERIRDDANLRYHMGAFTEAFERLKTAHSALTGISPECIEEAIFSKKLLRKPYGRQVDALRNFLDDYESHQATAEETLAAIKKELGN